MKRPRRAQIPPGVADGRVYWMTNDDNVPGDAWVCGDGGWHSRPVMQPCDEFCHCSIEAREMLAELNREYQENAGRN